MITTTGEAKDLAQLYAKIARVTAAMKRVQKNAKHYQGYQYATESDIVSELRLAMGDEKIAIIPSVDSTERIEHRNEKLGPITRLYMTFTVACGDTGASIQMHWIGDGQDAADKGLYKAYTGAEKYFLMKLFLVATGDDPEDEREHEQRPAQRQQQRPAEVLDVQRHDLVTQLRDLRQQLTAIGGTVVPLTSSQVNAMPLHELKGMIDATKIAVDREHQRIAAEVKQQELVEA